MHRAIELADAWHRDKGVSRAYTLKVDLEDTLENAFVAAGTF